MKLELFTRSVDTWRVIAYSWMWRSRAAYCAWMTHKLALSIKREIQSQVGECLTSSIGISANKLLAKLASNMQKPNGLTILPVETLPMVVATMK